MGKQINTGARLAIILFALVSIAHLLRLIYTVNITIGGWDAPQWISLFGFVVPGLIAWLLWRESNGH